MPTVITQVCSICQAEFDITAEEAIHMVICPHCGHWQHADYNDEDDIDITEANS